MTAPFLLLRDALVNLSLAPEAQRMVLAGAKVPDELALDLLNAVDSLAYAQEMAGVTLPAGLIDGLDRLSSTLDASPGDPMWNDGALDRHPAWREARRVAAMLSAQLADVVEA